MKTLEDALAAIEEMKTAHEAEKTALKNKNSELIDREKAAKDRADEAEAATGTELDKAVKRAEKAERELATAKATADTNAKSLREYKRDAAITQAIATANVDAKHVDLLTKALRADVEFSDDGEPLINGKTIDAHAKSFFAKDGLSYVRAQNNTGGLATGNDGTTASLLSKKPETSDEWDVYMRLPDAERAVVDKAYGI
jgi:hypothetical protein